MKIAVIGTGNIGGTLAAKWSEKGHEITLGVRDPDNFKGKHLLSKININATNIKDAVAISDIVLLSVPAMTAVEVTKALGDTSGKIIIDTMNIVMGRGPQGYRTTSEAILDNTISRDIVKCFNITGYSNVQNPEYGKFTLDMFVAGDSEEGKLSAIQLAKDAGFEECYDIGGNNRFELMEQFANFWINLAMIKGYGREIGFKLLKR